MASNWRKLHLDTTTKKVRKEDLGFTEAVRRGTITISDELYTEIQRRIEGGQRIEGEQDITLDSFLEAATWIWINQHPWQPGKENERKTGHVIDGTLGRITLS